MILSFQCVWTCVCNAMRASGLFRAIWNMEVGLCENSFMVNKVMYIAIFQREGGGWCQECERSIVGGAQAVWRHVWGVWGWWLISRRYTEDIQYLPDKKRTRLCSWRLLSPSSLSAPLENIREALVAVLKQHLVQPDEGLSCNDPQGGLVWG